MFPLDYTCINVAIQPFLFVVFCCAVLWIIKCTNYGRLTGPLCFPVVGHLPFFIYHPEQTLARWQQTYGNVYTIRLGSWETVVVNGFKAISEAAKRPDDTFSSRPPFLTQRALRNLNFGEESLIISPFDISFVRHQKLTSSALRFFMKTSFDSTQNIVADEANKLARRLLHKCLSSEHDVDVADDIQLAVGTISFKIFFGNDSTEETEMNIKKIIQTTNDVIRISGVGNLVEVMPWLEYVLPLKVSEYIHNLQRIANIRDQQIAAHICTFDENHIRDVIDAMYTLESDSSDGFNQRNAGMCSQSKLLCTIQDFIGGGFETSTALMIWLVKYMAAYPDVQKRVQDEIGIGRNISYKDRTKLPYTEAVLHEVMRVSCVLPFALPHYTTKDTQLLGRLIKRDTVIIFNLHSVAFDKDLWGDPETFRPERFLTADGVDRGKCSLVPAFGFGRRKCIGENLVRMVIFVLFSTLLQKCSFTHEGGDINFEPVANLVYRPKPFRVSVKKRI
ncbi:cytochrome P450 1A1-like [Mercenaria mercenaria]|uniref:cytochrome P450 1A1-like n=1 Tax=Mercenaria mercenaria TaxID=6596 RepID=UPI00234F6116|nr:cytochrome P450 1A1-like [Mercenaria mercenaria]